MTEYKISDFIGTLLDVIVEHGNIKVADQNLELEILTKDKQKIAFIKQKNKEGDKKRNK